MYKYIFLFTSIAFSCIAMDEEQYQNPFIPAPDEQKTESPDALIQKKKQEGQKLSADPDHEFVCAAKANDVLLMKNIVAHMSHYTAELWFALLVTGRYPKLLEKDAVLKAVCEARKHNATAALEFLRTLSGKLLVGFSLGNYLSWEIFSFPDEEVLQ